MKHKIKTKGSSFQSKKRKGEEGKKGGNGNIRGLKKKNNFEAMCRLSQFIGGNRKIL